MDLRPWELVRERRKVDQACRACASESTDRERDMTSLPIAIVLEHPQNRTICTSPPLLDRLRPVAQFGDSERVFRFPVASI